MADITWSYSDLTLTISGTGPMPDYTIDTKPPWDEYNELLPDVLMANRKIVIGEGITRIGNYNFSGFHFYSVSLPQSLVSIGKSAFSASKLKEVVLPYGLLTIEEDAFANTNLTEIVLPNGIRSVGSHAFYLTDITSAHIPASLIGIGEAAFYSRKLTDITVDSGNPGYYAADGVLMYAYNNEVALCQYPAGKEDTSYTAPKGTTIIWPSAFYYSDKLTEVSLPDSVHEIGESAFESCIALLHITIPESVLSIGESAFFDCESLTTVTMLPMTPPTLGESAFDFCPALTAIVVPKWRGYAYRTAEVWSDYASLITSERDFDLRSWIVGLVLGLVEDPLPMNAGPAIEPPEPPREPTSYSYNGVILPKLPEWDRESYPYAIIRRYEGNMFNGYVETTELHLMQKLDIFAKATYTDGTGVVNWYRGSIGDVYYSVEHKRDEKVSDWGAPSTYEAAYQFAFNSAIWTNSDLIAATEENGVAAGDIYLPKSYPEPIYE